MARDSIRKSYIVQYESVTQLPGRTLLLVAHIMSLSALQLYLNIEEYSRQYEKPPVKPSAECHGELPYGDQATLTIKR